MATNEIQPGTLYVVATPIGNRLDFSPRAQKILGGVDIVAAEDTRVSGSLLRDAGIAASLVSVHEHNEDQRIPAVLAHLREGAAVALISDAGTPLISDPGFKLVRAAREARFPVIAVPGPCAAVAALSVCGLPSDRFYFAGFVASKAAARTRQFEALKSLDATLIFYASKRQLGGALRQASEVFGPEREAAICRELTKLHEQTRSGTLASLCAEWADLEHRGEWVLLIRGGDPTSPIEVALEVALDALLDKLSTRDAAAVAAQLLGIPKREAYAAALARAEAGKR